MINTRFGYNHHREYDCAEGEYTSLHSKKIRKKIQLQSILCVVCCYNALRYNKAGEI